MTYVSAGRTIGLSGNFGDGTSRNYSTGIIYSPFGGLNKQQFGTTYLQQALLITVKASTRDLAQTASFLPV